MKNFKNSLEDFKNAYAFNGKIQEESDLEVQCDDENNDLKDL